MKNAWRLQRCSLQAFLLAVGVIDSGNAAGSRRWLFAVDDLMGINQQAYESKEMV